jgi:hypothetical protein
VGTAGIDLPAVDFPNAYPGATPQFAPYTQFNAAGQITGGFGTDMLVTNRSHSTFHSLQSSLTGSLGSRGPRAQANFTCSKSLDDTSSVIGAGIGSTSGATALAWPQNPFDTSADKSPSTFDAERVLTFTLVQDLPADGAPLLRALPHRLTRGWQLLYENHFCVSLVIYCQTMTFKVGFGAIERARSPLFRIQQIGRLWNSRQSRQCSWRARQRGGYLR